LQSYLSTMRIKEIVVSEGGSLFMSYRLLNTLFDYTPGMIDAGSNSGVARALCFIYRTLLVECSR
jgi:hypothetical protein